MADEPKTDSMASKGGKARAASMTKEERRESAKKAAAARWGASILQATYGSPDRPLVIGDFNIQAYVLEDGTRVLTQGDFQEALGRHRKANVRNEEGEEQVPAILQGKGIKPFISMELLEKSIPLKFRTPQGGIASGYRAEILPEVCEVFLKARDAKALPKQQDHIADRANILVRGLARVGIIALVDEATGYQRDRSRDALAKILEAFIAKELQPYARAFSADYYEELFRLRNLKFDGTTKRPQYIGHLTNNIVYSRLAPGVLQELRDKNPIAENGRRKHHHHRHLTRDVGHPGLKEHIKAVVTLMKASDNWDEFHRMLNKSLPVYRDAGLFAAEFQEKDD